MDDKKTFIEAINELGSRIKAYFKDKNIEDEKNTKTIKNSLTHVQAAISDVRKAVESNNNKKLEKSIENLTQVLKEKELSVDFKMPEINVPEQKVEVLKESKEAKETNELLKKVLQSMLRKEADNSVYVQNRRPEEAIPVKLTDKSSKRFYDAVMMAVTSAANSGSGGGGGNVTVDNFPSEYPLPADQLSTLTPPAAITGYATEAKQDDIILDLGVISTHSIIDANNSTTTPLAGGGTFTGATTDVENYTSAEVTVFADQDSASNGLHLETSNDGSNWDHSHYYNVAAMAAGEGRCLQFTLSAKYFRVVYENGGTAQTVFRLQTKLSKASTSPHFHEIDYEINGTHPAQIVRSILTAKKPDGTYTNIDATTGGNLKVSLEEIDGGADIASETTQLDVLSELQTLNLVDFATSAKQDTSNTYLASLDGKDFASQTTLAAILAKIIAAPATEAKQDTIISLLGNSGTGASSSVADSATSVTLLSSNSNRKGATFYNDSTATLYLKCGSTASSTSFTVVMAARSYYELPFKYTGVIDGIWSSAAGGYVRITEFT